MTSTDWVKWSRRLDSEGKPMIQIGGSCFPQDVAKDIAVAISNLLSDSLKEAPK